MAQISNPEYEQRKLEEFAKLPPVFAFEADGIDMIGAKSICPRCRGPLMLTIPAAQAAELEYSEVTPDEIAKTIIAGMASEQIVCGRCQRAQAN